jgi:hypothetical protein
MNRRIAAILFAGLLALLAGSGCCQEERIQRAERESISSSPRTLSWDPFACDVERSD